MRPRPATLLRSAGIAAAIALMLWQCWGYRVPVIDDAPIGYAYARSFAHGHGLVVAPGAERVEGYTDFLWIVLLGIGIRLGANVFVLAKVIGAACAVGTTVAAAELLAALRGKRSPLDALPAIGVASLLPFACWALSGLETGLYVLLVLAATVRLVIEWNAPWRRPVSAGLLAAAALTRPDGLLVLAAAGAMRLLRPRRWSWLLVALGPVVLHFVWRWAYYAWPLPNTFYAKGGDSFVLRELWDRNSRGWVYVDQLVDRYGLKWVVLAALASVVRGHKRWIVLVLLGSLVAFPLIAHGDWMPEGRFLVAALGLTCVLAVDAIDGAAVLVRHRVAAPALATVGVLVLAWTYLPTARQVARERRGYYPITYAFNQTRVDEYVRVADRAGVRSPSVLVPDIGAPTWAGLPVVDLVGLTDVTMARAFHHAGTERDYVFAERRPSFIHLWGMWLTRQLQDEREFAELYLPVRGGKPVDVGLWMLRSLVTVSGVDTRNPPANFPSEGLDLLGYDLDAHSFHGYVLVRRPVADAQLKLGDAAVELGRGIWMPRDGRPGEIVEARAPRVNAANRLCGRGVCAMLFEGQHGSSPVEPAPANATANGDDLYRGGRALEAAEQWDAAFAAYQAALAADPSLSFARRHLEAIRERPRAAHHQRWITRTDQAVRAFRLSPDPEHWRQLVAAATAAGEPEVIDREHRAMPIDLPEPAPAAAGGAHPVFAGVQLLGASARPHPSGATIVQLLLSSAPGAPAVPIDVVLDLPAGPTQLAVGATRLTVDARPFAGDFENGRTDGWFATDRALSTPHRYQAWQEVRGFRGVHYLDSRDAGLATGELRSPILSPEVDEVCFVGASSGNAGVELEVDGERGPRATGGNPRALREQCLTVPHGRWVRMVVYDRGVRPSDWVIADDFECIAAGRPTACSAAPRVAIEP